MGNNSIPLFLRKFAKSVISGVLLDKWYVLSALRNTEKLPMKLIAAGHMENT